MVVIGIDPHKASHTAVAVDGAGRVLGRRTVRARDEGHAALLRWGRQLGTQRVWAVEDCRHVSTRLERLLLAHGERVVRVPPKLMGVSRREQRGYGKSDPIDATAVARAAVREPDLPVAVFDESSRDLRLLVDRREDLVAERTREINRLQWLLHDLDPDLNTSNGRLISRRGFRTIADRIDELDQTAVVVQLCRDLAERIDRLTCQIVGYEREIGQRVREGWPELLELNGCGELTAAKLVGEIGPIARFSNEAKLAMHAGVAPLPASSGNTDRHRLNRQGNRQLNVAIHRIALAQARTEGSPGQAYRDRKIAQGKTKREATRCLKRNIVRAIYRTLSSAHPTTTCS